MSCWQPYEGFSLYCLFWQCFDILLMGTSVLTLLWDLWGPLSQIIWGGPQPALLIELIPIVYITCFLLPSQYLFFIFFSSFFLYGSKLQKLILHSKLLDETVNLILCILFIHFSKLFYTFSVSYCVNFKVLYSIVLKCIYDSLVSDKQFTYTPR